MYVGAARTPHCDLEYPTVSISPPQPTTKLAPIRISEQAATTLGSDTGYSVTYSVLETHPGIHLFLCGTSFLREPGTDNHYF